MRITKLFLLLAAMSALAIGSHSSAMAAGSAGAPLVVNATVNNNCTISTVPVSFSPYDPLSATADDSTGGSVKITCTKGATTTIGLNVGGNEFPASSGQRNMSDGTNRLVYGLYKDAPGGASWGNSGADLLTPLVAPSSAERTFPVYGRIPPGQDVPSGSFTDTVTATVNF